MKPQLTRACRYALLTMLDAGLTNQKIAHRLNAAGHKTAKGCSWSSESVNHIRRRYFADVNESLFQQGSPTTVGDFFPYELPIGADFWGIPPGPRRWQRKG